MSWALYGVAGYWTINLFFIISRIGKPRPPIGPALVAEAVGVTGATVTLLILAGLRLS